MADEEVGAVPEVAEGGPLCLHCLRGYDPLRHYCPHCGAAVGQLTPYIPFVNIRYQFEFWGGLWRKLWSLEQGHVAIRVMAVLVIMWGMPLMLVGLPFVLLDRRRWSARGFEVLVEAEKRAGEGSADARRADG